MRQLIILSLPSIKSKILNPYPGNTTLNLMRTLSWTAYQVLLVRSSLAAWHDMIIHFRLASLPPVKIVTLCFNTFL